MDAKKIRELRKLARRLDSMNWKLYTLEDRINTQIKRLMEQRLNLVDTIAVDLKLLTNELKRK